MIPQTANDIADFKISLNLCTTRLQSTVSDSIVSAFTFGLIFFMMIACQAFRQSDPLAIIIRTCHDLTNYLLCHYVMILDIAFIFVPLLLKARFENTHMCHTKS